MYSKLKKTKNIVDIAIHFKKYKLFKEWPYVPYGVALASYFTKSVFSS